MSGGATYKAFDGCWWGGHFSLEAAHAYTHSTNWTQCVMIKRKRRCWGKSRVMEGVVGIGIIKNEYKIFFKKINMQFLLELAPLCCY